MGDCIIEFTSEEKALEKGTEDWGTIVESRIQQVIKEGNGASLYACFMKGDLFPIDKVLSRLLDMSVATLVEVFNSLSGDQLLSLFTSIEQLGARQKVIKRFMDDSYLKTQVWVKIFMNKLPQAKENPDVNIKLGLDRLLEIPRINGYFFSGWQWVYEARYHISIEFEFARITNREILQSTFILPDKVTVENDHLLYIKPISFYENDETKGVFEPKERAMYIRPGDKLFRTIIHEFGHSVDPAFVYDKRWELWDQLSLNEWLDRVWKIPNGWDASQPEMLKDEELTDLKEATRDVLQSLDSDYFTVSRRYLELRARFVEIIRKTNSPSARIVYNSIFVIPYSKSTSSRVSSIEQMMIKGQDREYLYYLIIQKTENGDIEKLPYFVDLKDFYLEIFSPRGDLSVNSPDSYALTNPKEYWAVSFDHLFIHVRYEHRLKKSAIHQKKPSQGGFNCNVLTNFHSHPYMTRELEDQIKSNFWQVN